MASFANLLLGWYQNHQRPLPWRSESDPYRILLSEVMLQQTQVGTVIPYYKRWLRRFPTLESVATSTQDEVLKVWEGLGYYSRCRNFYHACQIVVESHEGRIPSDRGELRQLPGVGDYTASALLSFAFGQSYPVLDGNVNRVMVRLMAFPEPASKGKRMFTHQLNKWIDRKCPADFNQAMMDLGSLVCRKNQPRCISPQSFGDCPVTQFCKGYRQGNPERFPVRHGTRFRPHRTAVAGVIWDGDLFLIQQRPDHGLLGGLWEFPGGEVKKGDSPEKALVRGIKEETGLRITVQEPIGTVNHDYTHFSTKLHAFHCTMKNRCKIKGSQINRKWIGPGDIENFAFPRVNHKLFTMLDGEGWSH